MNRLYGISKSLDEYDLYDERMIDNVFEKEKNLKSHSLHSIGTLNRISRHRITNSSFYSYIKLGSSLVECNVERGSYGMWYPGTINHQHILDKLYFSFLGFKLCKILKIKT